MINYNVTILLSLPLTDHLHVETIDVLCLGQAVGSLMDGLSRINKTEQCKRMS